MCHARHGVELLFACVAWSRHSGMEEESRNMTREGLGLEPDARCAQTLDRRSRLLRSVFAGSHLQGRVGILPRSSGHARTASRGRDCRIWSYFLWNARGVISCLRGFLEDQAHASGKGCTIDGQSSLGVARRALPTGMTCQSWSEDGLGVCQT